MSTTSFLQRRKFLAGAFAGAAIIGHASAHASVRPVERGVQTRFIRSKLAGKLPNPNRANQSSALVMQMPRDEVRALGQGLNEIYVILEPTGHWQVKLYGDKVTNSKYEFRLQMSCLNSEQPVVLDEVIASGSANKSSTLRGYSPAITQRFNAITNTVLKLSVQNLL